MNDPLGLFDADSAQDPLGLFDNEEDFIDKAQGVWDVAANLGAQAVGTVASGLQMIPQTMYLGPDEAVKRHEKRMETTFTAPPSSETGKRYNEAVGKFLEEDVRQPMIKQAGQLTEAIPFIGDKLDEPTQEFLGTLSTDLFLNFLPVEGAIRGGKMLAKKPEPKLPGADKIAKLEEKPPVTEAPKPDVVQPELDLFSPDQKKLGRSPYDATPDRWAVDQNGIPYKPRLSEEVQRMEVPEQTHLFPIDEQAPVDRYTFNKRAEEQKALYEEQLQRQDAESAAGKSREIEQAYKERELGKKQAERDAQQTRIEEALIDLEDILREERVSKGSKRKDMQRMVPRSQRGAINTEIFKPEYDQVKRLDENTVLRVRGGPEPTVYAIDVSNRDQPKVIGHAKFGRDKYYRETNPETDNLQPKWVNTTLGNQKKGLATEMYKFVASLGNDIIPDDVQTPYGKKLWESMERKGVAKSVDFEPYRAKVFGDPQKRVRLPQSQRGAVDVRAVSESVQPDDLPTREVTLNDPVKAIGDLPGNKGIGKSYVSPDPEPKDIIREAMSGKDSDLKFDSVQSGATLTGMVHKSPLIRGVASLYQNATKRAELVTRQLIEPTEKKFKTLPKNELEELGTLMKHEMTARKEYTLSELKEAGFSDKQIEAYTDMRAMFNKAWEAQNSALEAMGKKPLTKQEAYLSSRWEGNWRAPVYDKSGKLVFYIAERSRSGAQKALEYLKENSGLELDMKKSKVEFKGQGAQRRGEVTDAYRTMLGILDSSDPRVATLKSIYEEGQMRGAFEALGQKRHFENKGNIRGFIGDRPWVKPGRDAVEMFQQQFQYAKAAFEWAELTKATTKAKEVLSNEGLMESQPNNLRYAQSYAKTKLGFGGHAGVEAIEGSLSKFFGRDAQTAYDALGGLKTYFILSKLAISPGFWISNFVQPLWTSAWHADLTAQGYKHNLSKTMANAGSDASAAIANRIAEVTGQPYRAKLSELGTEALRYAEDNGIVNRNLTDENATLGQHPVAEFGQMLGQATIGNIEHVARLNAFMGFVHHLEQSGKFTNHMQLFKQAEDLTNASMVDYRKGERPMIFDQTGLVGSAAASLQTFKFNYYNQLHYFWNQAKEGKWQGLAAFAGTQALVGGALSMPFLQEIDDAWETFKKVVPDAVHLKIKDFTIKSEIIKNLPDLVAFGGLSKLTGADFTSRFDAGNIADFSLDGLFPFIADILKQGQAVGKAIANPNQTTLSQAAYQVAPPGLIQGAVETQLPAFQSQPGTYKNPNKLQDQDADYQRTPGQETYRQFGLRELGESKERYLRNRQRQNEAESSQRLREQSTKFVDAMVRQDPKDMKTYAYRYIQYGGNAEELNQIIERESLKMFLTKEQIEAAKATSLGAVQRVKRMRELLK